MIACLVLSAGLSRRFGSPKALADMNGDTAIGRLQKVLVNSRLDEVYIILGAHAQEIKPFLLNHKKVKSVYNKDYNLGQTSSFQAGLRSLSPQTKGFLLLPVDFPLVSQQTIDLLICRFKENEPLLVLPTFNGKKGHPPLFSVRLKEEFLGLGTDSGLNTVVHAHQDETAFLPVEDPGIIQTFNTQEEFERLRQSLL
jgi:CTP:molybdopterin cytidylyltransferase MocA